MITNIVKDFLGGFFLLLMIVSCELKSASE